CVGLGALGIFAARKVFFTSGVLAYPSPPMRIPEAPLGDLPLLSATPGRGLVWGAAASAPSGLVWDWAQSREDFFMPFAGITMTSRSIGLAACVLGLGMLFAAPVDARKPTKQQRAYLAQPAPRPGVRGRRRNSLLDHVRPAGIDCDGPRARPVHSSTDSTRCQRLLRRPAVRIAP